MKKDFILSNKLSVIIVAILIILFTSYILHYFISKIPSHFIIGYRLFCILIISVSIIMSFVYMFFRIRENKKDNIVVSYSNKKRVFLKRLIAYLLLSFPFVLSIYCILALNLKVISEGFYFTSTIGWIFYFICYLVLIYISSLKFVRSFSDMGGNKELEKLKYIYKILSEKKYLICSFESFIAFYYGKTLNQFEKITWIHLGNRKDKKNIPNIELLCKFVIVAKNLNTNKKIYSEYKSIIEEYYRLPDQEVIEIKNHELYRLVDSETKRLKLDEHLELFSKLFNDLVKNI